MQENKKSGAKRYSIFFILLVIVIFVFGTVCNYKKDAATNKNITYNEFIKLLN